jgi:hypothetical protein
MSWVKFGAFRCLNPRLLISRLIAFRVLINPMLSMGLKKKKVFMGLGPKVSNLYKLKILIVNLRIFLCIDLVN